MLRWPRHGGRLWREVTGVPVSNFGFAVAAHPTDPECAWFVPAVSDQCRIPVDAALAPRSHQRHRHMNPRLSVAVAAEALVSRVAR